MKTEKIYNPQTRKVERVETWETVDEDGVINEYRSVTSETYRGSKYIRVFTGKLMTAISTLDKTSLAAMWFIFDAMNHSTNIAYVGYKDLEDFLNVSEVTVAKAMVSLQEVDVIRMHRRGQWMVNPEMATACYSTRLSSLIQQYQSLETRSKKERSNDNVTGQITRETTEVPIDGCTDVYTQSHKPDNESILGPLHQNTERD